MDTIQDRKRKKRESEIGLDGSPQGNLIKGLEDENFKDDFLELNGKIYELPPDINSLKEIDCDDTEVQQWLKEDEERRLKKFGRLTHEQLERFYQFRLEIERENPGISVELAVDQALEELRRADPSAPIP